MESNNELCNTKNTILVTKKKKGMQSKKRGEFIFLACVLAIPLIHFCIFYIGVNFNSILLAFKKYDGVGYNFAGWVNFERFFKDLTNDVLMISSAKNSLILYFSGLLISTPLTILISFFLYKKIPCSGFFKVVIFLPSIISGIVFVLIFKYFVDKAVPMIFINMFKITDPPNLLVHPDFALITIIFFGMWTGFGMGIILYVNAMSRIPQSLIESAAMEGITNLKELWHIVLPLIFPTLTTFLVTGVAGLFMGQGAVFAFYAEDARPHLYSFGYYFFIKVIGPKSSVAEYPYAAAAGLVFTVVAAPITLFVKYMLEKFGPSVEY